MLNHILRIMSNEILLLVQCGLFLLLNVLDGITTWLVLRPDHFERERNPIARWVFKTLKPPASIVFFKVLILSFLADFIVYWWSEALTLNIGLLAGNLLFIFVVQHNYRVQKRYQKWEKTLADLQRVHWIVE